MRHPEPGSWEVGVGLKGDLRWAWGWGWVRWKGKRVAHRDRIKAVG